MTRTESPNASRIARIAEHKDYAAAMEWEPPVGHDVLESRRLRGRGLVLAAFGALLAVATFLVGFLPLAVLLALVAIACAVFSVSSLREGVRVARTIPRAPLERRSALVKDRRSETELRTFGGRTTYYFTLELDDGSEIELVFPGVGAAQELLVTGITGVAYIRGDRLLGFKQIRT